MYLSFLVPNKVINLTATELTDTSVFLNWKKPAGNVDFYLVKFQDQQIQSQKDNLKVTKLIPGNSYTFTVLSGVSDNSTWSEEANITVHTSEFMSQAIYTHIYKLCLCHIFLSVLPFRARESVQPQRVWQYHQLSAAEMAATWGKLYRFQGYGHERHKSVCVWRYF